MLRRLSTPQPELQLSSQGSSLAELRAPESKRAAESRASVSKRVVESIASEPRRASELGKTSERLASSGLRASEGGDLEGQDLISVRRKSFDSLRNTPSLDASQSDYAIVIHECDSESGSIDAKRSVRAKSCTEDTLVIKAQPVPHKKRHSSITKQRRPQIPKNVLPRRNSEMSPMKLVAAVKGSKPKGDPLMTSLQSIQMDYSNTPKTKPRISTPEPAEPPRYAETAPSGRSKATLMSTVVAEDVSQLESMVEAEEKTLRQLSAHFKYAEFEEARRLKQEAETQSRKDMRLEMEFQKKQKEDSRLSQAEAEANERLIAKLNRFEEVEEMKFVKAQQAKEAKLRQIDDLRRARMKSALAQSTGDKEVPWQLSTEANFEETFGDSAAEHEEHLDQMQLQARAGELRRKYADIVSEKSRLLSLLSRINDDS
jgi:hypothetical protein